MVAGLICFINIRHYQLTYFKLNEKAVNQVEFTNLVDCFCFN